MKKISVKWKRDILLLILVPVILIVSTAEIFRYTYSKHIEGKYDIHSDSFKYFPDSIEVYDKGTDKISKEISRVIDGEVDLFRDAVYLDGLNKALVEYKSYIIVRSGERLTYIGNSTLYNVMDKSIFEDGIISTVSKGGTYIGGEVPFLIKKADFTYEDGEDASIYIIIDVADIIPEAEKYIETLMLTVIVIIILLGLLNLITLWKTVLFPMENVEKSLKRISDGDFDEDIEVSGNERLKGLSRGLTDIQQSLVKREELYHAQEKENKRMISNISHDLKTPITSIRGYAEGLLDGIARTEEQKVKYCRTILNKANELDTLIDELSLYSQVNRKHMMYEFQILNIKNYFHDCAEELEMDLENRDIEFIYQNYVNDEICIKGDSKQLGRVIQNIVNNSIKYFKEEKPIISLRVTDEDDHIIIRIVDNGQGIPQKDIEFIFDRFYRSDESRNSDTGGSGIGLAIVKEIVEDHGGEVWATSKTEVGTVIHIKLDKILEE